MMFPTVMKSLSVDVSRFSLIGKSVAAQFLINQARKLLWRKVLLCEDNEKFVFRRSANFGNVSPFYSSGNKHSELIIHAATL